MDTDIPCNCFWYMLQRINKFPYGTPNCVGNNVCDKGLKTLEVQFGPTICGSSHHSFTKRVQPATFEREEYMYPTRG